MSILRPHAARFHERHIHVFGSQKVIVVNVVEVARALANSSDSGLLGEQSSPKCEIQIKAFDADEPPCKI